MEDHTEGGRWNYRRILPSDVPDDYKKHELEWARKEVGIKLYDVLMQTRNPAVVKITETITPCKRFGMGPSYEEDRYFNQMHEVVDELLIEVEVNPVAWKQVTMPVMHDMDLAWVKQPHRTLIERTKWLLTGKMGK